MIVLKIAKQAKAAANAGNSSFKQQTENIAQASITIASIIDKTRGIVGISVSFPIHYH
jgi:hypothetical protein